MFNTRRSGLILRLELLTNVIQRNVRKVHSRVIIILNNPVLQ